MGKDDPVSSPLSIANSAREAIGHILKADSIYSTGNFDPSLGNKTYAAKVYIDINMGSSYLGL